MPPWHGSPASSPKTGWVQADFVSGSPLLQPGSRLRPKKYCTPSGVVTFQYSPSSSPFALPVSLTRSMRVPSSFRIRQVPSAAWISSPPRPFQLITALS